VRRWHVWVSEDGKTLSSSAPDEFNPQLITVTEGYHGDTMIQDVQKAAQLLNALNGLLPVWAEADSEGLDAEKLLTGSLARMGLPAPAVVAALVAFSKPAEPAT
jgi:hypothetical protein